MKDSECIMAVLNGIDEDVPVKTAQMMLAGAVFWVARELALFNESHGDRPGNPDLQTQGGVAKEKE